MAIFQYSNILQQQGIRYTFFLLTTTMVSEIREKLLNRGNNEYEFGLMAIYIKFI